MARTRFARRLRGRRRNPTPAAPIVEAARGLVTARRACYARRRAAARAQELPMPKAYWVTSYSKIHDPDKLAAYAKLAGPAIAPFGGRYLARGTAAAAYENGTKERIVISEFPSVAAAIAAHDGPAYQQALAALGDGADREIRIIEGLE
jgi:uncharacterized protein (DUF1330 family)